MKLKDSPRGPQGSPKDDHLQGIKICFWYDFLSISLIAYFKISPLTSPIPFDPFLFGNSLCSPKKDICALIKSVVYNIFEKRFRKFVIYNE